MRKIEVDDFYTVILDGVPWSSYKSREIGPRIGDMRLIEGKICYCYVVHERRSRFTGRVRSCECCWAEVERFMKKEEKQCSE